MRKFLGYEIAIILALSVPAHSAPTAIISDDPGGLIQYYAAKYDAMKQDGTRIIVAGDCFSACTMVLKLRGQACAQPGARLGFHAAQDIRVPGVPNAAGNRDMAAYYPANVRAWFYKTAAKSLALVMVPATRFLPKC